MGMNARRITDGVPLRANAFGPLRFRIVTGGEDAQRGRQARVPGTRDRVIQIVGERLVGEVAVTVDHAPPRSRGPLAPRARIYRIREPGAISPSNATRTGLPPSGLAARIIPFDSMPIS